ncbi:phosphatase PAP2 family protein [Frigidibacter sp. MR17.24]|uniref:phosphatase PAP2 family protein n=1 Tax=Frigidibacter sp. MR17.24 TaxID=3127345 RepID=UPI003012F6D4
MIATALRILGCAQAVTVILVLAVSFGGWRADRIGDRLQVALPLAALACQASPAAAGEFALRYAAMFTSAHAAKRGLGGAALNRRPDGGRNGFPSAHTATAVLGASALLRDCVARNPVAQGVVVFAATFVGASRIEAGRHDIWQVFAGAGLGLGCERLARRPGPARRRARRALLLIGNALRRGGHGVLAATAGGAAPWRERRRQGAMTARG